MLQLSGIELEQMISSELMENPALERLDDFEDPLSIDEILKSVAPQELKPSSSDREVQRSAPNDSPDVDWLDLTVSDDSLWDHLLAQLRVALPSGYDDLIVYLVGSVNDRGYLGCTVEDAALDCETTLEEAEKVLEALRNCEPAGVGAADLRDCLALQLRSAQSDAERFARIILKKHWEDLVARDKKAICRAYSIEPEVAEAAFEVILGLNPFPGESFTRQTAASQTKHRTVSALPDVIITLEEAGYLIEVPGPSPIHLRVSPEYEKRKNQIEKGTRADPAEVRHIKEFVERAQRFLDALTQRRQQLARIGKYLVENQGGFVRTGEYRFLEALTRSQVAKELGVHESTVSRATAGKFVQIVNGDVVSFEVFFKPALRVQKMIEEILESENPNNPLSDERIAQMLADKGVNVARRTVNKYRDRNKLLSSRLRRSG
jgi:RNA polymerase sigma-54 factor